MVIVPAECSSHDAAATHFASEPSGATCAVRLPASGETFCDLLNGGFISTQSNEPGASPTAAKASDGAVTSSITAAAPAFEAVARDIRRRDVRKLRIPLDQRHANAGHAGRQRQARRADARAKIDNTVTRLRRGRRSQQDRVMADPVTGFLLRQPQPAAEHGVVGVFVRPRRAAMAATHAQAPHRPTTGVPTADARRRPGCGTSISPASLPARSCCGPAPCAGSPRP